MVFSTTNYQAVQICTQRDTTYLGDCHHVIKIKTSPDEAVEREPCVLLENNPQSPQSLRNGTPA